MSGSRVDHSPNVSTFVNELAARADRAYPATLIAIVKALAKVEPDQSLLLGVMRHRLTRPAFVLGCAAEEIASVQGRLEMAQERTFVREAAAALRESVRPLTDKRIGPALRRLIKEFKQDPTRCRTGTVQYMLELQGLEELGNRMAAQPSCRLALECTVSSDGIAGVLWEQITASQILSKRNYPLRTAGAWQLHV